MPSSTFLCYEEKKPIIENKWWEREKGAGKRKEQELREITLHYNVQFGIYFGKSDKIFRNGNILLLFEIYFAIIGA